MISASFVCLRYLHCELSEAKKPVLLYAHRTFDPVIPGSETMCSKIQGDSLFEVQNFFRNDSILHSFSPDAIYYSKQAYRPPEMSHILYHHS